MIENVNWNLLQLSLLSADDEAEPSYFRRYLEKNEPRVSDTAAETKSIFTGPPLF